MLRWLAVLGLLLLAGATTAVAVPPPPPSGHRAFDAIDASVMFTRCLPAGQPWNRRLTVTDKGTGHRLSEAEIQAEKLRVTLVVNGVDTDVKQVGDGFDFDWVPAANAKNYTVSVKLSTATTTVAGIPRDVFAAPDTHVQLPTELAISPVEGGCKSDAHCVPLDLGKSVGLWPGLQLNITRKKPASSGGWAAAPMHLQVGGKLIPFERDKPVELSYQPTQTVQVCYAAPRCTQPPADTSEVIEIKPVHFCLADADEACKKEPRGIGCDRPRSASVVVKADVKPNSWLDCNLWWILIVAGVLLFLFIVAGLVTPNQFASAAMVRVANNDRQLRREQGRPLRREPGGKRGFYRTATVCFTDIGTTVKKSQGHILMLKAGPDKEIQIHRKGATLERFERNAWRQVDPVATGKDVLTERTLVSGGLYRVNNTYYFIVDF